MKFDLGWNAASVSRTRPGSGGACRTGLEHGRWEDRVRQDNREVRGVAANTGNWTYVYADSRLPGEIPLRAQVAVAVGDALPDCTQCRQPIVRPLAERVA